MLKEGATENSEKLKQSFPVVVIVEDSYFYGKIHQKHLRKFDVETIIIHGVGNFKEQFAEIKKSKNVVAIITDGLHGNWESVHQAALKNGIKNTWLITGNEDMIDKSKYFPHLKAISKADLHKNPNKYKTVVNVSEK